VPPSNDSAIDGLFIIGQAKTEEAQIGKGEEELEKGI